MDNRLFSGRYSDIEFAGEGGLTCVYRATDLISGGKVAIRESKTNDPEVLEALENEYRFAALYRHPVLLAPLSLVKGKDKIAIIQQFMEGGDLRSKLKSTGIDSESAISIMVNLLECTAFIHFCNYLYNDFKPENVLVDNDGSGVVPRLIDYNLVSIKGEKLNRRGTVYYMAPEVLTGEQPGEKSDIYSLGALFYEVLSGKPPFESEDNRQLIRMISESGRVDFTGIPGRFADGLRAMLSRNPDERPSGAREAAELLGLRNGFEKLYQERLDYYLTAGKPPFSSELSDCFCVYLKSGLQKTFLVRGLAFSNTAMNYMQLLGELSGYRVWRLRPGEDDRINAIAESIKDWAKPGTKNKSLLLIDRIDNVDADTLKTIKILASSNGAVSVAAGIDRWSEAPSPSVVFDPQNNTTRRGATLESLRAFLKRPGLEPACDELIGVTGGEPHLVYIHLINSIREGEPDPLNPEPVSSIPVYPIPEKVLEQCVGGILTAVDDKSTMVLKKLSVWGDYIPMLALGGLKPDEQKAIDGLLRSGHLLSEKDAVSFTSGAARYYVYSKIDPESKQRFHRIWATAVENRFSDSDDYPELLAFHWGQSDDREKGFRANIRAANFLHRKGELNKARKYAATARYLAEQGAGSIYEAASILATVLKSEGDYGAARKQYLDLLRCIEQPRDQNENARVYKEMGDLYRSMKKVKRAVYYTNLALGIFQENGDDQGIADCHNNMGLTWWINGKFEKALASFTQALAANEKIGSQQELAKIRSNLGIINDILGRTQSVAEHFQKARQHAAQAEDPRLESLITNNLGYFYLRQGDYPRAIEYLNSAFTLAEKIGYVEGSINSLSNLGLSHLRSGELFIAVDVSQRAMETAEKFGNRHLAASAEVALAEACILMGNYRLSGNVLNSLEAGKAYTEDKTLRPQVGLLRAKLNYHLGAYNEAANIASVILHDAEAAGDTRIMLEAKSSYAESLLAAGNKRAPAILTEIVRISSELGHNDLKDAASIRLTEFYLGKEDLFAAESWIENAKASPNLNKESSIAANIMTAELLFRKGKYDDALAILFETETMATVSGYIPRAFQASVVLAEIFTACQKTEKAEETIARANSYLSRIASALPENINSNEIAKIPFFQRLKSISGKIDSIEFMKL